MGPDAILAGTQPLVGELRVAASLLCLSAVLLIVFLGPLWRRLRTASEAVAVVGVAGGVLGAGLLVSYARDAIATGACPMTHRRIARFSDAVPFGINRVAAAGAAPDVLRMETVPHGDC